MKNRTVPYGYKYENGIIVLHPQEREKVKWICSEYLNGCSLLDIATTLNEQKVEYVEGVTGWNKSRLKRIIEDRRYLGTEPYPPILTEETHNAMQQVKDERNTQKEVDRKTDIFQMTVPVKCPLCGHRMLRRHDSRCKIQERWNCENKDCRTLIEIADSKLLGIIGNALKTISPESIQLTDTVKIEPSITARRINNEIANLLDTTAVNKAALREKIIESAAAKYADIDNTPYTARKIQAVLTNKSSTENIQVINQTVREIILHTDMVVDIILLNGQLIRREQTHGTGTYD